jgi:hypothetical protein
VEGWWAVLYGGATSIVWASGSAERYLRVAETTDRESDKSIELCAATPLNPRETSVWSWLEVASGSDGRGSEEQRNDLLSVP